MMKMKRVFWFLILLAVVCYMAGCGRVSQPVAPEGSTYPQYYIVAED